MATAIPPLSTRTVIPEVMDQPGLHPGRHRAALGGLARLNWLSGAARPYRAALREVAGAVAPRPVRLLDVAAGGGDVPVALARWARRAGIGLEITVCDANPHAVRLARERAARRGVRLDGFVLDVTSDDIPGRYDVVTCSLFLHHLPHPAAAAALRRLARATDRALVICDLARTRTGFLLALAASRLVTRSPVVHTDALLSVRAAFTPREALQLAREAGLDGAAIRRCWPQRFRLTWWRR